MKKIYMCCETDSIVLVYKVLFMSAGPDEFYVGDIT